MLFRHVCEWYSALQQPPLTIPLRSATGLRFVGDLKAHDGARVTALCAPDPAAGAPAPLYTGGSDGVVRAWDPRSGGACQKFRAGARGAGCRGAGRAALPARARARRPT